jgi:hypothetical protein
MALIKCPECGKEISDKAASCPHCGIPNANAKKWYQENSPQMVGLMILGFIFLAICIWIVTPAFR